jgi:hypothetical protein
VQHAEALAKALPQWPHHRPKRCWTTQGFAMHRALKAWHRQTLNVQA